MLTIREFQKKYGNGTLMLEENGGKIHGKTFGEKGAADAPGGSHLGLIWMVLKYVKEPKLLDGYRVKFLVGERKNIRICFVSCNARKQKKENFDVAINEPGWKTGTACIPREVAGNGKSDCAARQTWKGTCPTWCREEIKRFLFVAKNEFVGGMKTTEFPLLSSGNNKWTDDSVMTVAVAAGVISAGKNANDKKMHENIKRYMLTFGNRYQTGYGRSFYCWLGSKNPQPYNSWGNGSAMRVSAIPWLFRGNLEWHWRLLKFLPKLRTTIPRGLRARSARHMPGGSR